jgi:4-amino-4-deoxychorismate lyase
MTRVRLPGVSQQRVVALLGAGLVPADTPILRADDLGIVRGDGIFETLHVRGGQPWLLDQHLDRMARSAARLELDLPDRAAVVALARQVLADWPSGEEGALRIVCTRGPEDGLGPVTVFATVAPIVPETRRARRDGVSVLTASLGVPAALRVEAPWLLGGAKTVSYAVNMATQRWAQRAGAQDVLWVSSDGFTLEAPTSTLVWLDGATLCTVPAEQTGILAGITARHLLDRAGELGWDTAERMITPDQLRLVDGVWLTSSVRGLAAIRELDREALPPAETDTERIRKVLGFP